MARRSGRCGKTRTPPRSRRNVVRIERRLDALDQATSPEDMNIPGFNFHGLSSARRGTYSVYVNGPWCITFRWDGLDAFDVDLENYH